MYFTLICHTVVFEGVKRKMREPKNEGWTALMTQEVLRVALAPLETCSSRKRVS
jgi:hypothetical protein